MNKRPAASGRYPTWASWLHRVGNMWGNLFYMSRQKTLSCADLGTAAPDLAAAPIDPNICHGFVPSHGPYGRPIHYLLFDCQYVSLIMAV